MTEYDDLFGEAAENASQDSTADPSWGAELKLAENEQWAGRYRGSDVSTGFGDDRAIHLLEDADGNPVYIRGRTKLDRQFEKASPSLGDVVAIVRLADVVLDSGNTMHDYGVASKPATKGTAAVSRPVGSLADDDIPF